MKQCVIPRRFSLFRMFRETHAWIYGKEDVKICSVFFGNAGYRGRPGMEIRFGRRDRSIKYSTESRWLLPATPDVTCAA